MEGEDFLAFCDEPSPDIVENEEIDTRKIKKYTRPAMVTDIDVPWLRQELDDAVPPFVRFHNEILDFCEYISPTKAELLTRKNLFEEIVTICRSLWSDCSVHVFGSQMSGILTPNSDLDIAVLNVPLYNNDLVSTLYELANDIRLKMQVSYLEVISSAKVPIIKLDHAESKLSVDICINNSSGLTTGELIRKYVKLYPPLRPLTLVLKMFLSQRKLSETFSGGIGSFVLCNMIISFLLERQKLANFRNTKISYNLGTLLIDFFTLYGSTYNYVHTTATIKNGGRYYPKMKLGSEWFSENRAVTLSIENPDETLETPVDIGKNSFMIQKIRRTFEHAMQVLTYAMNIADPKHRDYDRNRVHSFLSFIIRPDHNSVMSRPQKGLFEKNDDVYSMFQGGVNKNAPEIVDLTSDTDSPKIGEKREREGSSNLYKHNKQAKNEPSPAMVSSVSKKKETSKTSDSDDQDDVIEIFDEDDYVDSDDDDSDDDDDDQEDEGDDDSDGDDSNDDVVGKSGNSKGFNSKSISGSQQGLKNNNKKNATNRKINANQEKRNYGNKSNRKQGNSDKFTASHRRFSNQSQNSSKNKQGHYGSGGKNTKNYNKAKKW